MLFETMVSYAADLIADRDLEHRIIFLKSWNEWAEGNFIEPDARWGRQFLEACRQAITTGDDAPSASLDPTACER